MSTRLTKCCNADIITKHGKEYPDGNTFYISTSVPVCEYCHEERPETYEACDMCGEAEAKVPTLKGDLCERCQNEELEKIMRMVRT